MVDPASTPEHLNQETDAMSTGNGGNGQGTPRPGDQPTARREWSYSRGWRLFSQIILHPGLRALIRFKWSGKENIPKTGGLILAPNHLSYADWPAIALFSDGYAHRYPVFMIKSGIFEVKVVGWLLYKFGQLPVYRGRGDAGLVLKQAERALCKGEAVALYSEGAGCRGSRSGVGPRRRSCPPAPRRCTCSRARRCRWWPGRRWTCRPTRGSGWAPRRCTPAPTIS